MAEVSVSALESRLRKLAEKARAARESGDLDYALEACAEVLKVAPQCVAVRRLQRSAQLRQFKEAGWLAAKTRKGLASALLLFARRAGTSEDGWARAEKAVSMDPTNPAALMMLGEVALSRGWAETAVFAFEAVRELRPEDDDNVVALGGAWMEAGRANEARRCAEAVLATSPGHAAAQELMRRASIAQTVAEGKWEAPTTFREKLR